MILALSALGVYSLNREVADLYIMFGIGILGFVLRRYGYPLAPIILGLVLGPMLETELRRALLGSRGDWLVLVERPMAAFILALALLIVISPLIARLWRRLRSSVQVGVQP